MNIKKRDMMLSHINVEKANKKYFSKEVSFENTKAIASIIKWFDVKEKVEVNYNFKHEIIIDNNYTWIQIAPINNNYWIKAMYDEKNELIEIYIDVTRNNDFTDISNPSYEDLFLDVIVPRKGHIYQMDDVELMKALSEGVITETEYNSAKTVCKKLISYLNEHHQEFLDLLINLKNELEQDLDSK